MDTLKSFNDALQYIEDNLDQEMILNEVAKRAYSSEYHFKRLFSLLSGITISEYIRRRRLTLAAHDLRNSDIKVIDVALKYEYQSPDAFARAFQSFHGVTPTEARLNEQNLKSYPKMYFQLTIQGGVEMKYRIVEKEPFKIVGIKYEVEMVGETLDPSYGRMMENISEETMNDMESFSSKEPHGIVHATADYTEDEGKDTFKQYIGAVSDKEPGDYSVLEVPSHQWAVFEAEGEWEQVNETWMRIYTEWLPSSSYELADGPEILASKDEISEIWIPVNSKK